MLQVSYLLLLRNSQLLSLLKKLLSSFCPLCLRISGALKAVVQASNKGCDCDTHLIRKPHKENEISQTFVEWATVFCIESEIVVIHSVVLCWELLLLHAAGFCTSADTKTGVLRRGHEENKYYRWVDGEEQKFRILLLSERGIAILNK